MLDPYLESVMFALFALAIGVVIFGGTTLAYFLAERRPGAANDVAARRLPQRSGVTVARDAMEARRDKAA
jgi:hypothetical protein